MLLRVVLYCDYFVKLWFATPPKPFREGSAFGSSETSASVFENGDEKRGRQLKVMTEAGDAANENRSRRGLTRAIRHGVLEMRSVSGR